MTHYRTNLQSLAIHHPELAERLRRVQPDLSRFRIAPTGSSLSTYCCDDAQGQPRWGYSRYNPQLEIERELSRVDRSRVIIPLVAGIGLGYLLRGLYSHCRDNFYDCILIEPDLQSFQLALHHTPLDDVLADPRLHIHLGTDLKSLAEFIQARLPSIMSSTLFVFPHSVSQMLYPEFYAQAFASIQHKIRLTQAEFDLLFRSGARIQRNVWANLPTALRSISLEGVRGLLQGKPVAVIAAGPSLDDNVFRLKRQQDRLALIAVDTAYRTLKRHGIEPHIVVSTDPTPLNEAHFKDIEPSPETILAFDPEVYASIPRRWPYRTLLLNLEKTALTRWIETVAGPFGYLRKGGSVGHTAFYLARELGADPIVFIGLDLAFRPDGGATHTRGSALHRLYASIPEGTCQTVLRGTEHVSSQREDLVWVEGIHGKPVPTSPVMKLYIHQFTEEFAVTRARLIDATEGGARLRGAEIQSLQQVIDSLPQDTGVGNAFRSITQESRDTQSIVPMIESMLDSLRQAMEIAQHGLRLADGIDPSRANPLTLKACPEWIEMESCFSTLYQSEPLTIALEQAVFPAVYQFVQKEKADQVDLRLSKYHRYFQTVLECIPSFLETIQSTKLDLLSSHPRTDS